MHLNQVATSLLLFGAVAIASPAVVPAEQLERRAVTTTSTTTTSAKAAATPTTTTTAVTTTKTVLATPTSAVTTLSSSKSLVKASSSASKEKTSAVRTPHTTHTTVHTTVSKHASPPHSTHTSSRSTRVKKVDKNSTRHTKPTHSTHHGSAHSTHTPAGPKKAGTTTSSTTETELEKREAATATKSAAHKATAAPYSLYNLVANIKKAKLEAKLEHSMIGEGFNLTKARTPGVYSYNPKKKQFCVDGLALTLDTTIPRVVAKNETKLAPTDHILECTIAPIKKKAPKEARLVKCKAAGKKIFTTSQATNGNYYVSLGGKGHQLVMEALPL